MDQSQYWMLMKRRQLLMKSHFQVSVHSWEEKAFAEDKGCVWPPRSYGCSFCKREFRSAQALGGHMNVHRRDRARLKQSLICQNPNDSSSPSSSSSRVSPQEVKRGSNNGVLNPNPEEMEDKRSCVGVETSLSVGLSSVFFPNRPACCGEEVINNYKRPKINGVSTLPFLVSKETYSVGFKPVAAGSMDELDLELRLGVLPKGHGSVKGVIDLLDVAKVTEDL